jgi:ABC-type branched-subunit amino acid transport system ATPase component
MFELSNVTLSAFGRRILDRVSLRIEKGDRILLDGPHRGGKTQLLRLLGGVLAPEDGFVFRAGKAYTYEPGRLFFQQRSDIACLWHRLEPVEDLRCGENVELVFNMNYRMPRRELRRSVHETLDRLGLLARLYRSAGEISEQEKIRLRVAMCSRKGARVLLIDRILQGAETETIHLVKNYLKSLLDSAAIIILTPEDNEYFTLDTSRRFWIENGRITES